MEKINNNIVAKIIFSIITIVIMGFIIYFSYIHYDNLAKENNKKKSEEKEEEKNNDEEKEDEEGNEEEKE